MKQETKDILQALEKMGSERTKANYIRQGIKEPVFGVATTAMKPLAKSYKDRQDIAEELYATNNYDAMYFAGMIADVDQMSKDDFERWMSSAYCYMIGDFIVSVTLAESDLAQDVASEWIKSNKELYMSAGYCCYAWLLGNQADDAFTPSKIDQMLDTLHETMKNAPNRAKASMATFLGAVGMSYKPLHDKALSIAKEVGDIIIDNNGKEKILHPLKDIEKVKSQNRVGFKRRNVRC